MEKIDEESTSARAVSRPPSRRQQEDLIDPGMQSLKPPSRSSVSSSSSSLHASAAKLTEGKSISQETKAAKRNSATYENAVGVSQNDTPELFLDDNGDTVNKKFIASSTASMSSEDSKLKAAAKTPSVITSYKKDPATMKVGASHAEATSSDLDAKIKTKVASNEAATKPGAVAVVGGDREAASSGLDAKIKAKVASDAAATKPGALAVVSGDNSDDVTMKKSSGKETLLSSEKPQMFDESNGSQFHSSNPLVATAPSNDIGLIHIHDDETEETKEEYERSVGAFSIPGIGGQSRNVDIEEGSQTDSAPPEYGNEDQDEILIKASVVEDSEIFQAEAVSEDRIRRRRRIICCLILLVVVINVIVLSIVLPKDPQEATLFPTGSPTPEPTVTPSTSPSSAPTTNIQGLLEALSPASIPALSDESSPQFRALEWIESNTTYYAEMSPLDILDSFALATLYYSTGGEEWFESSDWLERKSLCSWHGVGCEYSTGEPYVDEIILTRNRLRGKLPLEVSVISGLVRLDFSDNILTGDIPNELSSLYNLESLRLEQNNIVGTIPKSFGELRSLSVLSLSSNTLEGSIPETLANIPRLASLALDENNLSGEIPPSIGKLMELSSLKLMENRFETLPSEIGLMRKLDLLDVSENNIVGSIPSEIGLLRRIRMINLQSNVLSGNIPSTVGSLSTLTYLDVSTNLLNGNVTTELFSLPRLDFLDLSSNAFSGTVPTEVASAAKLEAFYLDRNDLVGFLPSEIGLMGENLATLSITGNSLNGTIPSEIGDLNNLVEINLGGRFSGSLPSEFGLMRDLERFNIAGSASFTGSIPSDFSLLSNLEIFYLSNCELTGRIPDLGKMSNLIEIDLSYNDLTGTIPDDIDALTDLLQLDLRETLIDGSIPRELWSLSTLQRLYLNDMALSGSISPDIGMMTDLEILDLGTNRIDGTLPTEIGKLTNLQYLDVHFNQFVGAIPTEVGMFVDISILDFSLNPYLSGQLPSEIGLLTLLEEFKLGANFLGGTIPSELGLLTGLVDLDVSGAFNTGGTIPTELGQLINLSFQFNLAVNDLTGTIPSELGLLSQVDLFSVALNELTGTIPTELGTLSDAFSLSFNTNFLTGTIPSEIGKLDLIAIRIDETNLSGLIPEEICLLEDERLSTIDFDCGEVFCECCNRKCPTLSPSASPMPSSAPTDFPSFSPSASPMPSSTPTGLPTLVECEPGFSNFRLDLKTDNYNSETTTVLTDSTSGENIISGGPYTEKLTRTVEEWCVPDGICAIFTIYDAFGDGICCGNGEGSYTIYLNREEVGTGGEFGSSESWRFGDCVPTSTPTGAPTGSPTTSAMPSISPAPTNVPWIQLGNDLDGAFTEWSGFSVSISEDGNTVAIGRPNLLLNDGYVTVMGYNASVDSWEQIGPNIDDNAGSTLFGHSLSLCKDASTVAVGANFDDENGEKSGSTRVFRYQADIDEWIQIGQTFYGQEEDAQAGVSVALNKDGTRLVFPVFQGDGNAAGLIDSGYVQIYDFNYTENVWTQVGQQIDGEDGGDAAGRAVSISDDGSVVAIGAHRHDGNAIDSGHVRVFQYSTNASLWVQLGESIAGGMMFGDRFGIATSLSSDGMTIASGSAFYDGEPAIGDKVGAVLIHQYDSLEDVWTQIGQTIQGETPGDYFGRSVSLSGDGNTVAVGAPGYSDTGATDDSKRPGYGQVFHYNSNDNKWVADSQVFRGELLDDNYGQSVGISNDGKTVAFGAPNNNYLGDVSFNLDGFFAGSVEIYRKP